MRPRAARVLYNVVDAWIPEAADEDLIPEIARRLPRGELRNLEGLLLVLEWEPRVRLRSRRGFAWLPRAERRRLLERSILRSRLEGLRRAVEAAWAERRQSRDGA